MTAEDKQILMKIVGSVVGLIIVGYLFGFLGVVIGLVAVYFLFKGSGEGSSSPQPKESIDQRIARLEAENKKLRKDIYNDKY